MKICKVCKTVVEDQVHYCPRCGATEYSQFETKSCTYCHSVVAVGTIVCPQCHKILPPEREVVDSRFQNNKQVGQVYIPPVQPVQPVAPAPPAYPQATNSTQPVTYIQSFYTQPPQFPQGNMGMPQGNVSIPQVNNVVPNGNTYQSNEGYQRPVNNNYQPQQQNIVPNQNRTVEFDRRENANVGRQEEYVEFGKRNSCEKDERRNDEIIEKINNEHRILQPVKTNTPKETVRSAEVELRGFGKPTLASIISLILMLGGLVASFVLVYVNFKYTTITGAETMVVNLPSFIYDLFPSDFPSIIVNGNMTSFGTVLFRMLPYIVLLTYTSSIISIVSSFCGFKYDATIRILLIVCNTLVFGLCAVALLIIIAVFNFSTVGTGLLVLTVTSCIASLVVILGYRAEN